MWQQPLSPRFGHNLDDEGSSKAHCESTGSFAIQTVSQSLRGDVVRSALRSISQESHPRARHGQDTDSPRVSSPQVPMSGLAQLEMCRTITAGVIEGVAQLEKKAEQPDLSAVLSAISKLGSQERPSELLEKLSGISRQADPQLTLVMSQLRDDINKLLSRQKNCDTVESMSRSPGESPVCDARPLERMMQELREELKVVRLEAAERRREARSDAEVLALELHALPQQVADMKQVLRKLDQKVDQTELLHRQPRPEFELGISQVGSQSREAIAAAVIGKLDNATLCVDQREVLQQLAVLPELCTNSVSRAMQERLSKNNSEMLEAMGRLEQRLDLSPIIQAITHAEVDLYRIVQAITDVGVDLGPIQDAISQLKLMVDHTPVLAAIGNIHCIDMADTESIASAVHSRMQTHTFNIDDAAILRQLSQAEVSGRGGGNAPVLEALQGVSVSHSEDIAKAVSDLVSNLGAGNSDVLQAVQHMGQEISALNEAVSRINIDNSPVLTAFAQQRVADSQAIANVESDKVDLTPVHDALRKMRLDSTQVLDAVEQISIPDSQLASDVVEKLRRLINTDRSEIVDQLRQLSVRPDSPMLMAMSGRDTHLGQICEEINRMRDEMVQSEIDLTPIVDAVSRIRVPDVESLAAAVEERMRFTASRADTAADLRPLIEAISSADVDLSPVLSAIEALSATIRLEMRQLIKQEFMEVLAPQTRTALVQRLESVAPLVPKQPMFAETVAVLQSAQARTPHSPRSRPSSTTPARPPQTQQRQIEIAPPRPLDSLQQRTTELGDPMMSITRQPSPETRRALVKPASVTALPQRGFEMEQRRSGQLLRENLRGPTDLPAPRAVDVQLLGRSTSSTSASTLSTAASLRLLPSTHEQVPESSGSAILRAVRPASPRFSSSVSAPGHVSPGAYV